MRDIRHDSQLLVRREAALDVFHLSHKVCLSTCSVFAGDGDARVRASCAL